MAISKLKSLQDFLGNAVNTVSNYFSPTRPPSFVSPEAGSQSNNTASNYSPSPFVQDLAQIQGFIESPKQLNIVPTINPFKSTILGNIGNAVVNIPGGLVNTISQGITAPLFDVGQMIGRPFSGRQYNYNEMKNIGRLGMQRAGIVNPQAAQQQGTKYGFKQVAGNVAETVLPIASAYVPTGVTNIAKEGVAKSLGSTILQGAKEGAIQGAGYGLVSGLVGSREEQNNAKYALNILGNMAAGGIVGGVVGGTSAGIGGLIELTKRPRSVETQLRDSMGRWTEGETPIKPKGMTNAQWNFQLEFNKKYGRNPYTPVYPKDLEKAIKYEAGKKQIGLSVRDINKDINPLGETKTIAPENKLPKPEVPPTSEILPQGHQGNGLNPPSSSQISSSGEIINPTDPFYNINRLNISNEAKSQLKEKITGEFKPEFEKVTGEKMSADEIVKRAQSASDELIQTIGREKTAELGAAQLRLRQTIAQMVDSGKVDKDLLEKMRADKSFSANTARLQQQRTINADPKSPNGRLLQTMLKNILDVNEDLDGILAKAKGVDFNDPKQATEFYRQFIKPKAGDWIDKLRYNSMLTSPNTHIINATSNWQGTGLITPIQKTIEGSIDKILSVLNPSRERTRFTGEGLAYARGYYNPQTVKAAFKNMWSVLSGERISEYPDTRNIPLTTGGVGRVVENALDIGGRALEAVDQLFMTLTKGGLESSYKYRLGKGVKIAPSAEEEASNLLFRGKLTEPGQGWISNLIGAGGEAVKKVAHGDNATFRWMAKLTLPFVNIGTNLAKSGFEYNPVTGAFNLIGNSDKIAQAAKMLIGAGVVATAVPFALSDRLTFKLPSGKRGDAAREAGMLDYAIKIPTPKGEQWVQYTKMHPAIAWQLATVAALTDAIKNRKITEDVGQKIADGIWSVMQFGLDQTYFKNVSDFMSGVQGNVERFASIPSNYVSQFIPFRAFASWLNRIIDVYQRKPDTDASFITQSLQQIQSQLPILSKNVPVRTNANEEPMTWQNRIFNAFSPYRTSPEKEPAKQFYDLITNTAKITGDKLALAKQAARNIKLENQTAPVRAEDLSGAKQRAMDKAYIDNIKAKIDQAGSGYTEYKGYAIYWDTQTQTAKVERLVDMEKAQTTAAYNLAADQLKDDKDWQGWIDATQKYIDYLKEYQKTLDPKTDKAAYDNIENTIRDKERYIEKYKSYGGFEKPKKVKIPRLKLSSVKPIQSKKIKLGGDLSKYKLSGLKSNIKSVKIQPIKLEQYPNKRTLQGR